MVSWFLTLGHGALWLPFSIYCLNFYCLLLCWMKIVFVVDYRHAGAGWVICLRLFSVFFKLTVWQSIIRQVNKDCTLEFISLYGYFGQFAVLLFLVEVLSWLSFSLTLLSNQFQNSWGLMNFFFQFHANIKCLPVSYPSFFSVDIVYIAIICLRDNHLWCHL